MFQENSQSLRGDQLYLRKVRLSDASEDYYKWMNDAEVTRFLDTGLSPNTVAGLEKYVKTTIADQEQIFLAIIHGDSEIHVGNVKFSQVNWVNGTAMVGIMVGERSFWGKGVATETLCLISNFAFKDLGFRKLTAHISVGNVGSIKAFTKAGFAVVGRQITPFPRPGKHDEELIVETLNPRVEPAIDAG